MKEKLISQFKSFFIILLAVLLLRTCWAATDRSIPAV